MKCDVCEKRDATALITMIVNGKKFVRRMCPQCVKRLQNGDAYATEMAVLATMDLGDANVTCPDCGTRAIDFQRTGRVGCALCYDAFNAVLQPLMARLDGVPQHSEMTPAPAEAPVDERSARIKALRDDMFAAVNAEEYERAAQLRDAIRRLEAEGGEQSP